MKYIEIATSCPLCRRIIPQPCHSTGADRAWLKNDGIVLGSDWLTYLFMKKYAGKSTPRIDMSILGVLLPSSTPCMQGVDDGITGVIPVYTP